MKLFKKATLLTALLLLILWIYKSWFISPIISAGDLWYFFPSMYNNFYIHPYAWYVNVGSSGIGGPGFAIQNGNIMASIIFSFAKNFNLGWENSARMLFYVPFIILSISSSLVLIKKIFPKNKFWLLAPIIFSLNTYILMVASGGQILIALSYSMLPIVFLLFKYIIDAKKSNISSSLSLVIVTSLVFGLQILLDLRIAFVTLIAVLIYLLISQMFKLRIKNIGTFFVILIIVALLNSYWLIPVFIFGINPIEQLGSAYSSSDIVKFFSFAKIENSMGLLHPNWPENIFGKVEFMKPEFLLLPILAFSSLLFIKKNNTTSKYILSFVVIGIVGIFLGKGASFPYGGIYLWMFDNIPGFQLFRDSFKWYLLIILSFTVLIPFSLNEFSKLIEKRFNFKYIHFIILGLFIVYFLILIKPAVFGELPGTFQKKDVPTSYIELDKFLSKDDSFFRTLWIPNTMLFGHYTNQHPQLTGNEFFNEFNQSELVSKISSPSSQIILEESSVKYVVIPEDTEGLIYLKDRKYDEDKYQDVVNQVDKINYLEKNQQFGKIIVYRTPSYKDHFWCDCEAGIDYEMINPTLYRVEIKGAKKGDILIFSESFNDKWVAKNTNIEVKSQTYNNLYNSFVLPKGDYELEVFYSPQKFVDVGIKISVLTIVILITILVLNLAKRLKK